jgi:hypothetical protein
MFYSKNSYLLRNNWSTDYSQNCCSLFFRITSFLFPVCNEFQIVQFVSLILVEIFFIACTKVANNIYLIDNHINI